MLMVFSAICLFGTLAFMRLTVELMPNTSFGSITIFIGVRGSLSPPQIENLITRKVEDAVSSVSHLENIVSTSRMNRSVVTLEFEPGTNMDFAALEVREYFNTVKDKLPQDKIEKPIIAKYEENDLPIYILALTSGRHSPEFLRELVEDRLKEQVLRVNGVANVEIGGGRERKIIVELSQSRLQALRIPIKKVIDAISLANVDLLEGDVLTEKLAVSVKTRGAFRNLDDLKNLPIHASGDGSLVRLKDIAEVKDSFLEAQTFSRLSYEGKQATEAVSLYVQKESNANTIMVTSRLEQVVDEFTRSISRQYPGIDIQPVQVQARHIRKAIHTVVRALLIGAMLAAIILFIFLRRLVYTGIVLIVIPISIMMTFTLMYFSGISINIISLSGLALGIGMLLDNSIVVLENIILRRRNYPAENLKNAALTGTNEMTLAIVASTLTTIIVFLPITFINKQIRMLYSDLSLTVIYSLCASLLVAFSAVPLFTYKLAGNSEQNSREKNIRLPFLAKFPGRLFLAGIARSGLYYYRTILGYFLRRRYQGILAILIIFVCAVLMYHFRLEKEFIGSTERNEFTIFIELDAGVKLDISNHIVKQVEKRLTEIPGVSTAIKIAQSRIEGWSSKIYVSLVPMKERALSTGQVIASLREHLADIEKKYQDAGAFIYFSEPQSSREFIVDVYGYDYEKTAEIANTIASEMGRFTEQQKNKGFVDIKLRYRPGRPTFDFIIDKDKAALHDISVREIADSFHAQLRGLRAGFFHTQAKELEIIPRLAERYRLTPADLDKLTVVNARGEIIPVRNLLVSSYMADRFGIVPSEIQRKNKSRMVQVSATLENISLTQAAQTAQKICAGLSLPKHYYCEIGGEYDRMVKNQKEFTFAIIMSILLVYAVLASLFESYVYPFIIMFTVPMAFIGVVAAIFITVRVVTIGVFIGLLMLGGIVVNNAIILVDRINTELKQKKSISSFMVFRTVFRTAVSRLRPIMMTTLTTILGLIPMALDRSESANLWAPLAITVIGGLTVSTFLTLVIIPSLYCIFHEMQAKEISLFARLFPMIKRS